MLISLESENDEIEMKLRKVSSLPIDEKAKEGLRQRLLTEKNNIDMELVKLRFEKSMNYNYDRKLKSLELRLKLLNDMKIEYKKFFRYLIALDREHIMLCLNLTNKNEKDINLDGAIYNKVIYEGFCDYNQTRTTLKTKWQIIII